MREPTNEAERVVFGFFSALGSGDLEAARALMSPDMTWQVMGRGVPGEGVHRGPDAIFAVILPIRALFEPGSPVITPRNITSNAKTVVIESHGGGRLRDGREYDNNYVMSLDVADGKVTALREYMDTYYVNQLKLTEGSN